MNPVKTAYYIFRYLGPRVVWLRAGVYLSKVLGITRRRFTPQAWDEISLEAITRPGTPCDAGAYADFKRSDPPPFLFPLGRPPEVPYKIRIAATERQPPFAQRLKLLAEDRCVYFFKTPSPKPVDWYVNPIDHLRSEPGKIWCDIPDYLPEQGDPRMLWEPSRAAWAIDLARARSHGYDMENEGVALLEAVAHSRRYAGRLFWRWVDSWMEACPPFRGFQWKCGQESAVRMIGIALGFWSLADDPATTPDRWVQFARLAWATGYRIFHHINYALSQKNNHALSEACGLLLISQLFPELIESRRWEALGRRVLTSELRRQLYDDGSYLQHSMNYHRVMLHVSLLALRLGELAGQPFDRDSYDRLGRAGEFLYQMMDLHTGRVPQYGNNDGAYVLPLNECDFADYRPAIQATHFLVNRKRKLPVGPWDEDLLWLFGPDALSAKETPLRPPTSVAFDTGGYYTLRRPRSWAMIRCHTYRDRPGQYDQLHVDLWWRGLNVLRDCGTYHYYVPGRSDLENYFKSAAAHNNIEIDPGPFPPYQGGLRATNTGARRGGGASRTHPTFVSRFLMFPWPRAKKRRFKPPDNGPGWFEGEHYDYDRRPWNVVHRRTVISLDDETWMIVDDLIGDGEHDTILRWHFIDAPYETDAEKTSIKLKTSAGDIAVAVVGHPTTLRTVEVVRGRNEPGRVQGFAAPYYGERVPIPTMEVHAECILPQRFITTVCPGAAAIPHLVDEQTGRQRWNLLSRETIWTVELSGLEHKSRNIETSKSPNVRISTF